MSKCQAKVKKVFSGMLWGTKQILENCPNDAKGEGIFCEIHGCFDCSLKSVENCSEHKGVKLCVFCWGKRGFKKKEEEERKKKIIEEGRKAFKKQQIEEAKEKERLQKEAQEQAKKDKEKERLQKEAQEQAKKDKEQRERERETN